MLHLKPYHKSSENEKKTMDSKNTYKNKRKD